MITKPDQILQSDEVVTVLKYLKSRKYDISTTLVVFRLAACCGLRRMEISGLDIRDVLVDGPTPVINIRKDITKGRDGKRRPRSIPLYWDAGTLRDITAYLKKRLEKGAGPNDPFVVSKTEARLYSGNAAKRWKTLIKKSISKQRSDQVPIHGGRKTFCSHALNSGRSLMEVRDAAGHASINTTSLYLYAIQREDLPDIYPEDGNGED